MPYPDYIEQKPKIIFFTDFDGTITLDDCCDWLVETEGYGREKLRQSCEAVMAGELHFGEASREQIDSIKTPFNQCMEKLLAHVRLDPHFIAFQEWAASVSVPVVVLSSGITEIIRPVLAKLIGPAADDVEVIANTVVPREGFDSIDEEGGSWRIEFHDKSVHGHDKSAAIKPYANHVDGCEESDRPILLYAGDGISDLSAAKETDLLYAKAGMDLAVYCAREGIPFTEFQDWKDILRLTQDLYYNRKTVTQIKQEGLRSAQES